MNCININVPIDSTNYTINNIGCLRYDQNSNGMIISSCIEPIQSGIYLEKNKHKIKDVIIHENMKSVIIEELELDIYDRYEIIKKECEKDILLCFKKYIDNDLWSIYSIARNEIGMKYGDNGDITGIIFIHCNDSDSENRPIFHFVNKVNRNDVITLDTENIALIAKCYLNMALFYESESFRSEFISIFKKFVYSSFELYNGYKLKE